ncbi:MAG: thioredoxin family protein [Myxococcota bacterium]|nr:thioredoxin family protein [Myxococcota bacterium]
MNRNKLLLFALVAGAVLFLVPWILPVGPDTQLDAARFLDGGQFAVGALVVWLGGLLTAMTPCVYPLIPITVSVFGARKDTSRGKAVILTSAYIVGMGIVFAGLGILAAKTGQAFGSMLGNPWVVGGLAVFLLVLASSMFGAFELALPSGMASRLSTVGGAGIAGALLMGAVSGFLAAPCTGPVLTGLLAFVAKTQSTVLGGSLLFIYALGIGVPFFLIGVFAIKLPKGGVWMEWVKSVLGITLVALAATYIRDAVPALREASSAMAAYLGSIPGAAIAGVVTAVGVLLGAIHLSFKARLGEVALKTVGVTLVVAAILVRIAALNEHSQGKLWVDLGWAQAPEHKALVWHHKFPSEQVTAVTHFEALLNQARADGKPVMIDFYADWCAACKELDRETYVAPTVVSESDRFVNIKVDGTNEEDAILALYDRFGVQGLPTVAFISSEGQILQDPRVTGFLKPDKFLGELQKVR